MQAGKLRHRITIERNTPTQNAGGELIDAWATLATVWAAVRPITGREYLTGRAETAEITTQIMIRYRADVRAQDRVTWGSRTYDIGAVLADPTNHRQTILMCSEVAPNVEPGD